MSPVLAFTLLFCLSMPQGAAADRSAERAVAAAEAAVAAAAAAHGENSLEVASQLVKLATLQRLRGDVDGALASSQRALAIRTAGLPPEDRKIAIVMANVGALHVARNEVDEALPFLRRARDLLVAAPPSRARIGAMVDLGICEVLRGDYDAALATLRAGVDEAERLAPDHPYRALALQNLAQIQLNRGDVEAARTSIEAAVEIFAMAAPDGPLHAHALQGLGMILLAAHRPEAAAPLLERAVELRRRLHGEDSEELAECFGALGALAEQRGDQEAACARIEAALRIAVARHNDRRAAVYHAGLARLALASGDAPAALAAAERALAAGDTAGHRGGQRLPAVALRGLALAAAGRDGDATAVLRPLLDELEREGMTCTAVAHAARRALAQCAFRGGDPALGVELLERNIALVSELLARTLPGLNESERLLAVRRYRPDLDLLLERTAADATPATVSDVYACVLHWKGQVARAAEVQQLEARRHPEGTAMLARLQQIAGLLAIGPGDETLLHERERLETRVSREMPIASAFVADATERLVANLSEGAVVADFVHYTTDEGGRFAVFVASAAGVRRHELGRAEAVTRSVATFVQLLGRSVQRGSERAIAAAAAAARAAVYDPIAAAVDGCPRLWISPDDVVATLPFAALPGETARYLVEEREVSYLMNAADLLAPVPAAPTSVVAFGAIEYGSGAMAHFPPLPGTANELAALRRAAGDRAYREFRGGEATEAALRAAASGAGILHLATHGSCALGAGDAASRSAVALAFANSAPAAADGVLTAAEATFLDLRDCRLVTLSACDTGLGEPFAGESLLGLRRSLRIAGAAASLTSVWRIDDTATAALVADFYDELLARGRPPATALRSAQLAALRRARAVSGEGLPGLWAAFVLEGR